MLYAANCFSMLYSPINIQGSFSSTTPSPKCFVNYQSLPTKWYAPNYLKSGGTNGTLSGTVTDNGTPVAGALVRCYYRPNGYNIATTKTNSSGGFSFTYLDNTDTQNYFVIAFEPTTGDAGWSGNQYNAIIFDLLTPV